MIRTAHMFLCLSMVVLLITCKPSGSPAPNSFNDTEAKVVEVLKVVNTTDSFRYELKYDHSLLKEIRHFEKTDSSWELYFLDKIEYKSSLGTVTRTDILNSDQIVFQYDLTFNVDQVIRAEIHDTSRTFIVRDVQYIYDGPRLMQVIDRGRNSPSGSMTFYKTYKMSYVDGILDLIEISEHLTPKQFKIDFKKENQRISQFTHYEMVLNDWIELNGGVYSYTGDNVSRQQFYDDQGKTTFDRKYYYQSDHVIHWSDIADYSNPLSRIQYYYKYDYTPGNAEIFYNVLIEGTDFTHPIPGPLPE